MNDQGKIPIDFWLDDKPFASRYTYHVPSIGDEVRFQKIVYKVNYRLWLYDHERFEEKVILGIELVPPSE